MAAAGCQNLVSHSDGSSVSTVYNADGTVHYSVRTPVSGPAVTTTNVYDPNRGFLTSRTTQYGSISNTISCAYDDAGNKLSVQTPAGTTHYTYDQDNRLATVESPDTATTVYGYDHAGNRASVQRPNGVLTSYAYNTLNRLTNITNYTVSAGSTTVISSYTYKPDNDGRRVRMIDSTAGTTNYGYDEDGRLVTESGPGVNNTYTYDSVGNRVALNGTQYHYDADDRNLAYTYDADGNVLNDGNFQYTYDEDNELLTAHNSTTADDYAYDPGGNRVQMTANGSVTNYVVDTSADEPVVVEETDSGNNELARYDYGDDLVRMDRALSGGGTLTTSYYLFDGSGSTRQLTNTAGAVTDSWTYDAYGDTTRLTGTTINPYLYDGQEQDAGTGLYYLRARYYNPADGRLLSQDPLDGSEDDPISLHKYLYAGDDPMDMADPSGQELADVMVSTDISAQLAGMIDTVELDAEQDIQNSVQYGTTDAVAMFAVQAFLTALPLIAPAAGRILRNLFEAVAPGVFDAVASKLGRSLAGAFEGISQFLGLASDDSDGGLAAGAGDDDSGSGGSGASV